MLGKLLKKDFRSTYRFFLPLMGGYIIAAAVGKILFEIVLSVLDSAGHTSALSEGIAIFSVFSKASGISGNAGYRRTA